MERIITTGNDYRPDATFLARRVFGALRRG